MTDSSEFADLEAYLGPKVAAELALCAAARKWTVRLPANPLRFKGYTAAAVATLIISDETGSRQVMLKTTPPDAPGVPAQHRAADAYVAAGLECPEEFRAHLVLHTEPPWRTVQGGALLFQVLAADDVLDVRPMHQLPYGDLRHVLRHVTGELLRSWNSGALRTEAGPVSVESFLGRALGASLSSRGSLAQWALPAELLADAATWIVTGADSGSGGDVCPNPLLVALGQGPSLGGPLDPLIGRGHGDLHLGNVLLPASGTDPFRLIDLDTYRGDRELTADPVCLLLSAIAHRLLYLPARRWDALLHTVARPDQPADAGQPFDLVEAAFAATADAVREVHRGWSREWARQFRLSTLACALAFTTFTNLGPKRRWWFFRLASQVARELVAEPIPPTGLVLSNPFRPPRPDSPDVTEWTDSADMSEGTGRPARRGTAEPVGLIRAPDLDRLLGRAWRHRAEAAQHLRQAADKAVESGNPAKVVPLLRALATDSAHLLGSEAPQTLEASYQLATWLALSGNRSEALDLHEQVWLRRQRTLGPTHSDTERSFRAARDPELY